MRLVSEFARAYPGRTALMLVCLLLAGLAEGVGISSLVPLMGLLGGAGEASRPSSGLAAHFSSALRSAGLEPTPGTLLLVLALGMTGRAALLMLANRQVGYSVAHMATDLRLALLRALLRSRWQYYVHTPLGVFANAVASEARRASDAYLHAATLLALTVQAAVYVVVGLFVSWQATLVALLATLVIAVVLNRLVHSARRAGARQTTASRALLEGLTDVLQSVKPLKAMGREVFVAPLLERETRQLNRALRREVLSREALQALLDPMVIAFLAAGLYAAQTRLALPLTTVVMLAVVCARIVALLGQAQKEYQRTVTCESAFWSLRSTIEQAEGAREEVDGDGVPTLRRAIELRGVHFGYDGGAVLNGASLVVSAGELTAIVGPSGAGKTTVADLLIGLIRPQAGAVLVDGAPLQAHDARRWRALVGYVPQDTFLLPESVRMNVALGDPALFAADVEAALRAAGAWEFVASLPQGMETVVGERGLGLSGGQRQRIALARALVGRPRLLILDEATSALDPATEAEVCATLRGLAGAMTVVAISHQGGLVDVADRVYRVDAGTITPIARAAAAPHSTGE